jgi:hypothetical protein
MSFFNSLVQRVGYGAIMYNGSGAGLTSCYPFFTSQSNLEALTSISSSGAGTINIADVDDYWTVMPGYKLEVYLNVSYGGSLLLTGNNTNGTVPVNYTLVPNQASSIKLYFNNILIDQPVNYDTLSNGVAVSGYANTYNLTFNSLNYRMYEFYAGSTGTLSVPLASSTVSNIQCLLIGGGGSGSHMQSYQVGVGGGGAGAFLMTTIPVTAGDTFNINVGAGGAAAATGWHGSVGFASSIQRTTGGQTHTLTAGGGGGGGGGPGVADNYQGPKCNPWGSTGGVCPWSSSTTTAHATVASNSFTQTSAVFGTVTSYVNPGGTANYVFYNVGVDVRAGGSGGGGAGGVGGNNGGPNTASGGAGGNGRPWTVTGSRLFAGGGGGMVCPIGVGGSTNGAAGSGGGGAFGVAVTENTGSGGGPGFQGTAAGKGANGICIIAIPV